MFAVAKPQSTKQTKHKASATEVAKHKESASSDNTQNGTALVLRFHMYTEIFVAECLDSSQFELIYMSTYCLSKLRSQSLPVIVQPSQCAPFRPCKVNELRDCAAGAGPPAEDTTAAKKTSQTFVKLAVEEVPASEDEFIKTTRPPPVEERDAFIVQNTPALVDDDPTRFGLVDFLSSKGI